MSTDCIFCKIVTKAIPSHIVFEDEQVMAFLDAFPISAGHTLVIPRQHFESHHDLTEEMNRKLSDSVRTLAPLIRDALGASAYNLGLNAGSDAGQIVKHVHWHVIPRYAGDGLVSWPSNESLRDSLNEIAATIRTRIESV